MVHVIGIAQHTATFGSDIYAFKPQPLDGSDPRSISMPETRNQKSCWGPDHHSRQAGGHALCLQRAPEDLTEGLKVPSVVPAE